MLPNFDQRLESLGLKLPTPPEPLFNYVPTRLSGDQLFIAGQLHLERGHLRNKGKLGADVSLEIARKAARICGLNILSQVREGCGGTLNKVVGCLRLTGYINSTPECEQQAGAMDGCSDLMVEVFGDAGRHVRTCVGVASLPLNGIVVVEATFQVDLA
jgi:enamine deaminase RidA (YjgF/YER057c/UK114 family)